MRRTIFQEDWWLDTVAPGQWQEVVVERGGRMMGSLRYVPTKRSGFRVCQQPPLARVSGPVVEVEGRKEETRQRAAFTTATELLDQLPEFDFKRFILDPCTQDALPYLAKGYRVQVQHTFLVDCARPTSAIWSDMRDKTRNLIRRAQERLEVTEVADPQRFVTAYRENLGKQQSYVELELIPALHAEASARDRGRILEAVDSSGELHAAVFTIWDKQTCYYFLSTRNERVADTGAVSLLIWSALQHAQTRGLVFDFDGVTSASRLQFLFGFGGKVATRYIVEQASLLYDARSGLKNFARRALGRPMSMFID